MLISRLVLALNTAFKMRVKRVTQVQYFGRYQKFSEILSKMISLKFWITMLNHFENLPTMLVPTKLHRTVNYMIFKVLQYTYVVFKLMTIDLVKIFNL